MRVGTSGHITHHAENLKQQVDSNVRPHKDTRDIDLHEFGRRVGAFSRSAPMGAGYSGLVLQCIGRDG